MTKQEKSKVLRVLRSVYDLTPKRFNIIKVKRTMLTKHTRNIRELTNTVSFSLVFKIKTMSN